MKVRAAAMNRFGENNIREGARWPRSRCAGAFTCITAISRATAKLVGGEDYTFSLRGKGDRDPQIIAPEEQRRALAQRLIL